MKYVIETSKRDLSHYAEECLFKNDEGHNAKGTGEECDDQCTTLDGDMREIKDHGTEIDEYDDDHAEEHGTPVEWAVWFLSGSNFPSLHNGGTANGGKRPEHDWLSGSEEHPYFDQFTEWSVYLRGDWTERERFQIFERVTG